MDSVQQNLQQIHIKNHLNKHLLSRPQHEELIHDESLQKVMNNVLKQRLQKLLNEKLSKRKSIQSLIRKGILKSESTSSNDNLTTNRRDMYRRMSNHSLTEFLSCRPTLNELVKANMVHDVMTWTKIKYNTGIIPNKRNCHQMILHKNQKKLYIIGGYNTGSINIDVLTFNIDKNQWFRPLIGGSIPIERYSHSVVNINNKIYMFGGFNVNHKWLNDLYTLHIDNPIHNSAENTDNNSMLLWDKPKTTGNAPTARAAHASALIGHKMYIFGGNNGNKVFNDLYCLDTISMKWCKMKAKGHIPCARSAHTMTAMNNKLLVFGGINENGKPLNDLIIFDIETNKWFKPKINGTPPPSRGGHSAVCIKNNELFIFGGGYNGKILNDLHIFNIDSKQWLRPSDTGIIPTPRTGASIISDTNNVIYIFGGGNVFTDTLFNDLYVLDTGYFTTDNKQLNKLIYAGNSNKTKENKLISNQMDNENISMNNKMNFKDMINDDIAGITKEMDNMIGCVEYAIQQKIEQFKQKEEAYIMILRSIEAERKKLTEDIHKDVSLLKFSVKESMDKLQQNFINKMVRKHVDYVNNKPSNIVSENKIEHKEINNDENENDMNILIDNEIKLNSLVTEEDSNVMSEMNICSVDGGLEENTGNGLNEQMAANQKQMMIQYQKQLERFNALGIHSNSNGSKKKRRKKKRRGRRRRKKK
eukprot:16361_1